MAERVEFNIEDIRQFGRSVEQFCGESEDIVQRMNSSLASVQDSWRDSQLEKPAENIMQGNANLMRIVSDLYPLVQDFLRRQAQWWEEYTSN